MDILPQLRVLPTSRVARLKEKGIEEQVKVDNVTLGATGISTCCRRPTMGADESSIDVVKDICPNLTNIYYPWISDLHSLVDRRGLLTMNLVQGL